jgi:hypothetical protein
MAMMSASLPYRRILGAAALLLCAPLVQAAQDPETRSLSELRNTVVNLLQGLVERGVLTKAQAEQMVRDAQTKAQSEAAAEDARAVAEKDAVRVPYVPQIVKDEIRRQVAQDLAQDVTKSVVDSAQNEGWGVPAALPDWVKRMRWYGDMRLRGQGDLFASDNLPNAYIDFQRANEAGGIGKAGLSAFSNVSEDRERLRGRLRLGFESNLGRGWQMGARITTGNLRDPVSTNQTLGNTGGRYQAGFDLAYVQWSGNSATVRHAFDLSGGRIRNPWVSTDLVWDQDVTFEGIAANYRLGLQRDDAYGHYAFVTVGAFPLQEVELARDKWLLGSQLGIDWKFAGGSRARFAASYYDYRNLAGQRNTFESSLLDYTAPQFLQRGNTLFDIRNDNDPNTNLFALAADYRLVDVVASFDWRLTPSYRITFTGDYVQNIGYDAADVRARTGFTVEKRNKGYQGEIAFGSVNMAALHAWRASVGYRYLQRDAVLDAFTDSDFRLGGTDVQGYFIGGEFALSPRVNARLRYLSGNEIDGPPLGIDLIQLDLNASF